jgi:hypothetical protein
MTTTPSQSNPDIRLEQMLELIADHIESNTRVVSAVESLEQHLPEKMDQLLKEHRQETQAPASESTVKPDQVPAMRRELSDLIQTWGITITVITVLSAGVLLFFVLRH